ncbi:MAG: hypothetical protein JWR26_654 [Pedosphaera sp.]|nr:hypothetical protein [Pedosphaera sp.]
MIGADSGDLLRVFLDDIRHHLLGEFLAFQEWKAFPADDAFLEEKSVCFGLCRAVRNLAEDGFDLVAAAFFVLAGNGGHEALSLVMGDEIDGGAAEAAAGQAGAEAAGDVAGEVHEGVEFRGAVLEEVAGAFVALEHVLAEQAMVVLPQCADAMDDALDFSDHMEGALILAFGEFGFFGGEAFGVHSAERGDTECVGCAFALDAEFVVIAGDEGMFHTGIADDDGLADEGRDLDVEGLEVDFHDVPGLAKQGGNHVEKADADANEVTFSGATELGDVKLLGLGDRGQIAASVANGRKRGASVGERVGVELADGEGGGDFQCGGAAHARAHGNGAVNGGVEAAEMDATFAELFEHAFDVVGPMRGGILFDLVEPEDFGLGKGGGDEFDFAIMPGGDGHLDGLIDGNGKDESLVVIDVVAKEFEAARCADVLGGGLAKMAFKECFGVGHLHQYCKGQLSVVRINATACQRGHGKTISETSADLWREKFRCGVGGFVLARLTKQADACDPGEEPGGCKGEKAGPAHPRIGVGLGREIVRLAVKVHEQLDEPADDQAETHEGEDQLHGAGNDSTAHQRAEAWRGELIDDETIPGVGALNHGGPAVE